jgi:hypothetical protein
MANLTPKFRFPATLTDNGRRKSVTAFNANSTEGVFMASDAHPNWDRIIEGLSRGDENVWELFDNTKAVLGRFNQVTDRVSWDGTNVLFDGTALHTALSDHLARAISEGNAENYTALAKFWEKLESNPDDNSRRQAYDFLATHKFQITSEGDVVGYKGMILEDDDDIMYSVHSSNVDGVPSGYVNGDPVAPRSRIAQRVGDVVTMPRNEVRNDPNVSCARGLHVATHDYAASYGDVVAEVHVNPRDIVSVPRDGGGAKVRVWRYEVARVAPEHVSGSAVIPATELSSTQKFWAGDVGYKV